MQTFTGAFILKAAATQIVPSYLLLDHPQHDALVIAHNGAVVDVVGAIIGQPVDTPETRDMVLRVLNLLAPMDCDNPDCLDQGKPGLVQSHTCRPRPEGQQGECSCAADAHGRPVPADQGYGDGEGYCPCCRTAVLPDSDGVYRSIV